MSRQAICAKAYIPGYTPSVLFPLPKSIPISEKTAAYIPDPGLPFYNRVKAGFILQNSSLEAWCREHNLRRQNVTSALLGGWRGPKARELVTRISAESKPEELSV